ncbi:MAG: hypothetical protein QUS09_01535, partial [Methanotrichaceae archaeon]|nr:hypothetical protein [Methanotrichaceae archaeon]
SEMCIRDSDKTASHIPADHNYLIYIRITATVQDNRYSPPPAPSSHPRGPDRAGIRRDAMGARPAHR